MQRFDTRWHRLGRVEHVGSSAVPWLIAKLVVDLQVSVYDVEEEDTYRPRHSGKWSSLNRSSRHWWAAFACAMNFAGR